LQGKYLFGDGRKLKDPFYMTFSDRNCNYPQPKYAKWWLTQLRRWGFTEGAPNYEAVARQVMRGDIYEEAMKEHRRGGPHPGRQTGDAVRRSEIRSEGRPGSVRREFRGEEPEGITAMDFIKRYKLDSFLLPLVGLGAFLLIWFASPGRKPRGRPWTISATRWW
jgi:hypothetical protein